MAFNTASARNVGLNWGETKKLNDPVATESQVLVVK